MSASTTEQPTPPPAGSRPGFVLRIAGGCVVVAIVVGIGLVARGLGDDELTLPDRVGGLAALDSDPAARTNAQAAYEYNSEKLSDAFDGADAVTRSYGTGEDEPHLAVMAVRAETGPPLPVSFDDPDVLRTAAPRNELVDEGDVTCLLTRSDPQDEAPSAILCQRSGGDLTVRVFSPTEPDLDDVVDATDEVWDELS